MSSAFLLEDFFGKIVNLIAGMLALKCELNFRYLFCRFCAILQCPVFCCSMSWVVPMLPTIFLSTKALLCFPHEIEMALALLLFPIFLL
jgi:hypothetical protein